MPDNDPKLWSYTGTTGKRKKRVVWPEDRPLPPKPKLKRRNQPLVQDRAYPREWIAVIATLVVGGGFLLILVQFNAWLALAALVVIALIVFWELSSLVTRRRRLRGD
jgi:4-hydroxybenzoate polyprenyltransferase